MKGTDVRVRTFGAFKHWIREATFYTKNLSSGVEVTTETAPLVIHLTKCKECDKVLADTKIFDVLRTVNWKDLDFDTIRALVSCISVGMILFVMCVFF